MTEQATETAETMTRAAYARRVGVSRERVRQLEAEGRVVIRDGQVDVPATDELIALTMDTRQPASKAGAAIEQIAGGNDIDSAAPRNSTVVSLSRAKLRAEEARALKLELEAGALAGRLIELDRARAVSRRVFGGLRARLQGVGHSLGEQLAGESDPWECGDAVQSAIDAALSEAAAELEREWSGDEPEPDQSASAE